MKASLLAFMDIPQSGQVKSEPDDAAHSPVRQPGQRSSSGTPARALSMCLPHPAQVNFCRRRSGKRDVSCCMEDRTKKFPDLIWRDYFDLSLKQLMVQLYTVRHANKWLSQAVRQHQNSHCTSNRYLSSTSCSWPFLIDCSAKCGVSLLEPEGNRKEQAGFLRKRQNDQKET